VRESGTTATFEGLLHSVTETDFDKLYSECGGRVFNTLLFMLGNRQDAEDVFQEVFLRAYAGLEGFRGKAELSTWLYSIAMNAARGFLKQRSRRLRLAAGLSPEELEMMGRLAGGGDVEKVYSRKEINGALRKALLNLSPDFREAFVLNQIEGCSYKETAEIMGVSIGTVESRLFRAKEQLRKELIGMSYEGSG